MEQRKWINYGDVNFLEHGGCLVAPSYSEDEIKENPALSDVFNVFKVITDAGDDENAPIFAALYTIDISDYEDKKEMILEAAGFESKEKLEKSSKMPASEWAKEIVEYGGGNVPSCYHSEKIQYPVMEDYFISKWDLIQWVWDLGAAECVGYKDPLHVYCWIEDIDTLIVLMPGDGCQMEPEDYLLGDCYIDYSLSEYLADSIDRDYENYEEDEDFIEGDGGIMLYFEEEGELWTKHIEEVIRCALDMEDDEPLSYRIIAETID